MTTADKKHWHCIAYHWPDKTQTREAAYLERAIETRTAERKRISPRRRWLRDSRLETEGRPPILESSDSVASSHSWKPPSSNSRYFFW